MSLLLLLLWTSHASHALEGQRLLRIEIGISAVAIHMSSARTCCFLVEADDDDDDDDDEGSDGADMSISPMESVGG